MNKSSIFPLLLTRLCAWQSPVKATGIFLLAVAMKSLADDYTQAEQAVKHQPCAANKTVDQILTDKHRTVHTDLGWRVFNIADDTYMVERAFLVSKSAQIRYQWLIHSDSPPQPVTERAQNLCAL